MKSKVTTEVPTPVFYGYNRAHILRQFSRSLSVFVLPELAFDIPLESHLVMMSLPPSPFDADGNYGIIATTPVRLERMLAHKDVLAAENMRPPSRWDHLERRITILTGRKNDLGCYSGMRLDDDPYSLEGEIQEFFDLPLYLIRAHRQGQKLDPLFDDYVPLHQLVLPHGYSIFDPEKPCPPANLVIFASRDSVRPGLNVNGVPKSLSTGAVRDELSSS